MNKDLLYEKIYQETQNCGRAQFVKLLQQNQIKIEQLQQKNKELKEQLDIKNSGYMASIEEVCEYATILIEFEKWLEKEILKETPNAKWFDKEKYEEVENADNLKLKPKYVVFKQCLEKLQELKGDNE